MSAYRSRYPITPLSNPTKENWPMKLYRVSTTAKEYSGCRDVVVHWVRDATPENRRPYADLIKDYEPGTHAEDGVEEMFTWDEAQQLRDYLEQNYGNAGETVIEEIRLPIENRGIGFGELADGEEVCMLSEEAEYSLPFKVWGYCDLEGCTLIDNGERRRNAIAGDSEIPF